MESLPIGLARITATEIAAATEGTEDILRYSRGWLIDALLQLSAEWARHVANSTSSAAAAAAASPVST